MSGPIDLSGRVALITGAGRGIGLEIARQLSINGARVICHDAGPDQIAAGGEQLPDANWIAQDLRLPEAAASILSAATGFSPVIDILVLNAAMQFREPPAQVSRPRFQEQIEVNLHANLGLLQGCLPAMGQRGWGRVLTIGSIQQVRPNPNLAVYAATKSALKTMALAMARPHFPKGVTANNISPGLIDTPRNLDLRSDPASYDALVASIPAGRAGRAAEVAAAAAFLCSEAAGYITGADLPVDGGAHLPD